MTLELIKCPFCGYKFRMDVNELVEEGKAQMAKGLLDFLKNKPGKSFSIDIKCPNCEKTFVYEVKA